jgi:hypothetical protein
MGANLADLSRRDTLAFERSGERRCATDAGLAPENGRRCVAPCSEHPPDDVPLPPPAPVLPRPSARAARSAVSAGSYSFVAPRMRR